MSCGASFDGFTHEVYSPVSAHDSCSFVFHIGEPVSPFAPIFPILVCITTDHSSICVNRYTENKNEKKKLRDMETSSNIAGSLLESRSQCTKRELRGQVARLRDTGSK